MKELIKEGFSKLGGTKLLRLSNQTPRILFWHGVDNLVDPFIEAESVSIENFRKQIDYLNRYFEIISIDEFYFRFSHNKFTNKEMVLTFDDGYKNNLAIVAPILNEKKIPFTVFVSTNHISTGKLFPTSLIRLIVFGSGVPEIDIQTLKLNTDIKTSEKQRELAGLLGSAVKSLPNEKVEQICNELIANISVEKFQELKNKYSSVIPLNWDEVDSLTTYNCTIGSHCLDHFCCHENQDMEETERQVTESKTIIEEKTGQPCHFFAYPNGNFTHESNTFIEKAGYKMGFTTQKLKIKRNTPTQAIPRVSIPGRFSTFRIIVNLYPKK